MRSFKHIAVLIKTKRLQHPNGYSQSDLSSLLGYKNGQFISNVERGLCNIPLKMLKRVSNVLNIEPSELKRAILKDHEDTLNSYLRQEDALDQVITVTNSTSAPSTNESTSTMSEEPERPQANA